MLIMNRNCALVITYNRPELLLRCLYALINQSKNIDAIIVIDNGSNDITRKKLEEEGFLYKDSSHSLNEIQHVKNDIVINYFYLEENRGPGFAFYMGVKKFFNMEYSWLWMMDDDGYPDKNCFNEISKYKNRFDFINPLVLDDISKNNLSFGIYCKKNKKHIKNKADALSYADNGVLLNTASPFNGTLISKDLVGTIGFPLYNMYGWGVEVEYEKRAMKCGYDIATVANAYHYHPVSRVEQVEIFNGRYKLSYQKDKEKNHIEIRNRIYILLRYSGFFSIFKYFLAYSYFYFKERKIKEYFRFLKSYIFGVLGLFK